LATLRLSTFNRPQGLIVSGKCRRPLLSRADDHLGVYLINLNEFQLCIWLYKGEKCLLVDIVFLREILADLRMSDDTLKDEHIASLRLSQVGDNAEFALLKIGRSVLHLDIKCRTLRKVYAMTSDDCSFNRLHPLTMIWPPKFPVIRADTARFVFWPWVFDTIICFLCGRTRGSLFELVEKDSVVPTLSVFQLIMSITIYTAMPMHVF
jgi:hypothetical protein